MLQDKWAAAAQLEKRPDLNSNTENRQQNQWEKQGDQELYVPTPDLDFMNLALHVFADVALGISPTFFTELLASSDKGVTQATESAQALDCTPKKIEEGADTPAGFTHSFTDTLHYITFGFFAHSLSVLMLPRWLPTAVLPAWVRKHRTASFDFSRYLKLPATWARAEASDPKKKACDTLLGTLAATGGGSGNDDSGLTDAEITGNLFTIGMAGHEMTARTLNYALVCLALYPDVQEWLCQNIDEALSDQPDDPTKWRYEDVYPKLTATLCPG